MEKESISIVIVTLLVVLLITVGVLYFQVPGTSDEGLKKFSSYEELENYIQSNVEGYGMYSGFYGGAAVTTPAMMEQTSTAVTGAAAKSAEAATPIDQPSEDYSTTNIQVAGVDEADIVKNDGKYIYVVSNNKVIIVDAYPAESAKILSEIEFDKTVYEIFINKDKLTVFGWGIEETPQIAEEIGIAPPIRNTYKTFIKVYDVTDRSNPVLKRDVYVDGNYFDSRMIGDYVYAVVNQPVNYNRDRPIPLPIIESNGISRTIQASEIYYFDFPDYSYVFTNIVALNTQNDGEGMNTKTYLMGYSENMYVSPYNIYVVFTKRFNEMDFFDRLIDEAVIPIIPINIQLEIDKIRKTTNTTRYEKMQQIGKVLQDYFDSLGPEESAVIMKKMQEKYEEIYTQILKEMEKTIIHKISISNGNIDYKTKGDVPGYVLNQFSMDEFNGNFRIATTTGRWRGETLNHVYILDSNLVLTGKVEDLAHGERIYSVRFMGNKGYMVTFRQVDPLFVIDLSDPYNPQVLGYLKIPGVSDYLHPYDETHLIGVGRDATEQGVMKGMKLSLFDVNDFENPKELSNYMIGERGTYSEALNDHKAFLFNKERGLLVIPVTLSEGGKWRAWEGAYVFNLDLIEGFVLKGRITHVNETGEEEDYYYDYISRVRRSLYIGDTLYTISSKMIKMNDLFDLEELNKVDLPGSQDYYPVVR